MKQFIIEKRFADTSKRIQAEVSGTLPSLGSLVDVLWTDFVSESKKQGRVLFDKDRYFYEGTRDTTLLLRSGTYKDFITANNLLE